MHRAGSTQQQHILGEKKSQQHKKERSAAHTAREARTTRRSARLAHTLTIQSAGSKYTFPDSNPVPYYSRADSLSSVVVRNPRAARPEPHKHCPACIKYCISL